MMAAFDTAFHSQLLNDRFQLLELIDAIDDKNRRKVEDAAAALRRSRKGRGRPRKPRPISQEDQARRLQYQAELEVVYAALNPQALTTPNELKKSLRILAAKKITYRQPSQLRAYRRYRDRKIERLLALLPGETQPLRRSASMPWKEELVRTYLFVLRGRHRFQVNELEIFPRDTPEYRRQVDEAKARLAVVERFLSSDHLSTREVFLWRAPIIGDVPDIPARVNSAADFRDYWKLTIVELIADLSSRYAPGDEATDPDDDDERYGQSGVEAGEVVEMSA
jgi:hypothetical protein